MLPCEQSATRRNCSRALLTRSAFHPPAHGSFSNIRRAKRPNYSAKAASDYGLHLWRLASLTTMTRDVPHLECNSENEIRAKDQIRCRDCGHRVLYKKRTRNRMFLDLSIGFYKHSQFSYCLRCAIMPSSPLVCSFFTVINEL